MKKIICTLASSVALLMVASAGVAQSSNTNSAVTRFIATATDKPAKSARYRLYSYDR